jgi:F-type H+-transporting ATPase subunit a
MKIRNFLATAVLALLITTSLSYGQHNHDHNHDDQTHSHDHGHDHSAHDHGDHAEGDHGHGACGGHHGEFQVGETAMHHIADANVYSIGPLTIPLPCMLYNKETGWDVFMSSKFEPAMLGHGDGHKAINKYVLHGGTVKRVADASFPMGEVEIKGFRHGEIEVDGKMKDVSYVCTGDQEYLLDQKSTADGGLFGGGVTSFYDFSLTKNVTSMFLVCAFLFFMFRGAAKQYKAREGKAPKGVQSLLEVVVVFLRDEVAKPFLGHKWEKFFPFLLSIFFFILGLNLFGQVPFLGGSNVTGNLGVTMVLAIIAFIITNINGNGHYWSHLFLAPGVPAFVKPILIPVEVMGIFIKPLTLMLRLFANITAGHIVMIVFVGLIFIFGKSGESMGGALGASVGSTLLTMFMMAIELIVAFVQAFVFTILTASYIGAATEEVHH